MANLEGPPISPVTFVGLATKASHAVPTCGYGAYLGGPHKRHSFIFNRVAVAAVCEASENDVKLVGGG